MSWEGEGYIFNPQQLQVVTRAEWGALPPTQQLESLRKPCLACRYWRYSKTPSCHSQEECVNTIRDMQKHHIQQGLADIRFNFLIGDDGNVYEGRGFDKEPPRDEITSEIWGRYFEFCFIGDHRETPRIHNVYYLAYLLLDAAMKNGTLRYDFFAIQKN